MKWKEEEHPRDENGKFSNKSSNGNVSMKRDNRLYTDEKVVILPKQEYAELCSAIRTKYGNRIPKSGRMLYSNHYYWYNYNNRTCQITCAMKIKIDGNEEKIKLMETEYDKRSRKKSH